MEMQRVHKIDITCLPTAVLSIINQYYREGCTCVADGGHFYECEICHMYEWAGLEMKIRTEDDEDIWYHKLLCNVPYIIYCPMPTVYNEMRELCRELWKKSDLRLSPAENYALNVAKKGLKSRKWGHQKKDLVIKI